MSRTGAPGTGSAAPGLLERAGRYDGPPPVVHPETEEHWRALSTGRLLLQRCSACATLRFPLAPVCWVCGADGADWAPVPPTGSVAVAVTVHRALGDPRWAGAVPFVVAQVDLDVGLRLPGRVVDASPYAPPRRGTPVTGAYLDAGDGVGVLCFRLRRPARDEGTATDVTPPRLPTEDLM